MQLTLHVLLFPLLSLAAAAPSPSNNVERTYTNEYDSLGCPKSSTKAWAGTGDQLKAIKDFTETLFYGKDAEKAFNTYVAEKLINHAPDISGDGRQAAKDLIGPRLKSEGSSIEIKKTFVGQNQAGVFFKGVNGALGTGAIMEIFRFSGTCIVEHWVVSQAVNEDTSPNPRSVF